MLLLDLRIFLLLTLFYGSKAQRDTTKVHTEKSKVLPYQVRVGQCVGSLIKLEWILTAKHCVSKEKYDRRGNIEQIRGYFEPTATTVWAGEERRTIPTSDIIAHREEDLVLLRVDPPFEESEFIKPIQYNNDAANLGPVNVLNEVSMFKWIELGEDKTCKKIEVKGLPKQVMKTQIKIYEYVPEETDKTRSRHMIMYSAHRDDNACWGDNEGPAVLKVNNEDVLVGVGESIVGKCESDNHFYSGTSSGKRCSSNFLNVVHYKDWIEKTINTGTCADGNTRCSSWGSYCKYHDYVRANCKKTCNLCDGNRVMQTCRAWWCSKNGQNGNWKNGQRRNWNRRQRDVRG